MPRGVGDTFDQFGQYPGHAFDLFERDACILRQPRATHHFAGGLLHGDDRLVGVVLDRPYQRLDLFGGRRRTLGEPLDFVGNHGKTTPGITRHGRLNGRIEGQNVGLIGNVIDQADNVADFLRRLTQTLDALGGVLNLLTNVVHAPNGVVHHLAMVTERSATDEDSEALADT